MLERNGTGLSSNIRDCLERKWYAAFLPALAKTLSVTIACKAAGINRRTAYDHREADPEFVEKFQWNAAVVIKTCASRQLKYPKAHIPRGSEGKACERQRVPSIGLKSNGRSNRGE
jgi:hypothetical protein